MPGLSLLSTVSGLALSQRNQKATRHSGQPEVKANQTHQEAEGTWAEPKFYADVEYRDITSEGLLRASSFKRLSRGLSRK